MPFSIRPADANDYVAVIALNDLDVRHLSPLTRAALEHLAAVASYF